MKKLTHILLFFFLLSNVAYGQQGERKSKEIEIYFDLDSCVVDLSIANNNKNFNDLIFLLDYLHEDKLSTLSKIKIDSYASPEAGYHYNQKLTRNRSAAIYEFLMSNTNLPDSLVETKYSGIDWKGLRSMVETSDMDYRNTILHILDSIPEETWDYVPNEQFKKLVDSRNKHLMDIYGGRAYKYLLENFYPKLRRGSVVTIYYEIQPPSVRAAEESLLEPFAPIELPKPSEPTPQAPKDSLIFALKTNLLYDLALSPNIEVEIPIGRRVSLNAEWIFPWWVTKDNGNALEMLSGQIEGRYWLGERAYRPLLTGWFAGLYVGGGYYDFQYKDNGYQGEFYIAAGLSAGYAHTINAKGNLRMEYSLGLGYLKTQYRYYEGKQDNEYLVWQHDGAYTWLGPTKARVSLVWFINWIREGGVQ